jgi:hypothetical protein
LPSHLAASRNGAVGSPLLGYLLDGAEDARGANPSRERVSRDSAAQAVGQVLGGWTEKAVTRE